MIGIPYVRFGWVGLGEYLNGVTLGDMSESGYDMVGGRVRVAHAGYVVKGYGKIMRLAVFACGWCDWVQLVKDLARRASRGQYGGAEDHLLDCRIREYPYGGIRPQE